MTSGSCKLVPEGFGMSKRMLFNFLLDEAITAITSLSASEISCRACLMVTSSSGPDVGSSDLFLLFSLICMGCTSDQIWKARCRSFFWILWWSKSRSSSPLRRTFMSYSVESLDSSTLVVFFSGVCINIWASALNDCICSSASCCSTFSPSVRGSKRSTWISFASNGMGVIVFNCRVNSLNICSTIG